MKNFNRLLKLYNFSKSSNKNNSLLDSVPKSDEEYLEYLKLSNASDEGIKRHIKALNISRLDEKDPIEVNPTKYKSEWDKSMPSSVNPLKYLIKSTEGLGNLSKEQNKKLWLDRVARAQSYRKDPSLIDGDQYMPNQEMSDSNYTHRDSQLKFNPSTGKNEVDYTYRLYPSNKDLKISYKRDGDKYLDARVENSDELDKEDNNRYYLKPASDYSGYEVNFPGTQLNIIGTSGHPGTTSHEMHHALNRNEILSKAKYSEHALPYTSLHKYALTTNGESARLMSQLKTAFMVEKGRLPENMDEMRKYINECCDNGFTNLPNTLDRDNIIRDLDTPLERVLIKQMPDSFFNQVVDNNQPSIDPLTDSSTQFMAFSDRLDSLIRNFSENK